MKTPILKCLLALILLTQPWSKLQAQGTIATAHVVDGGGRRAINANINIGFGSFVDYLVTDHLIFDDITLTPANVGQLFTITQSEDADFNSLVGVLTDGAATLVGDHTSFGHYGAGWESGRFNPLPAGGNGIDFQGFRIDSIALRLDSLTLVSPGSNPNGDGLWTDYSYAATVFVNGEAVPEPSSHAILGMSLLVLWAFIAARKCKRNFHPIAPVRGLEQT